ncbi:hypothetical protein MSG28_011417 [Choristoneura fumiferana]|uniref:Uncharacterized protein n=1 Tax=Choristoneura fumiferana TaxID=7141 RepID=A0ACC0JND0_CHOFU|nr:hypothetical protein MSG28_011417 [Choristoneura fumiferana]
MLRALLLRTTRTTTASTAGAFEFYQRLAHAAGELAGAARERSQRVIVYAVIDLIDLNEEWLTVNNICSRCGYRNYDQCDANFVNWQEVQELFCPEYSPGMSSVSN